MHQLILMVLKFQGRTASKNKGYAVHVTIWAVKPILEPYFAVFE